MKNDCLDILKAIWWMLDGAKYLWKETEKTMEKVPTAATVRTFDNGISSVINVSTMQV